VITKKSSPRVLGVIPARGGSKRLPGKNIALLQGRPLICHTIEAVRASTKLTNFVVSSEDAKILEVARRCGAPTPFVRPISLATDTIRNVDVVIDALTRMEELTGLLYDMVFLFQPTSPVRSSEHIDECIQKLWNSNLNTLASIKGPFQKRDPILKKISSDGSLVDYRSRLDEDPKEPFFIYNASVYGVKREYLISEHSLVSEQQVPFIMDDFHSIDIDTKQDLLKAELMLANRDEFQYE